MGGHNNERYAKGTHTPWAGAQSGKAIIDQLPVSANSKNHQCQTVKFEVKFDDVPLVLGNLDQNLLGNMKVDQDAGEVWLTSINQEGFDICMKKGDLIVENYNWMAMEHSKERQFSALDANYLEKENAERGETGEDHSGKNMFRSQNPNMWAAAGRDVAAKEWLTYPSLSWRQGTSHKSINARCREIPYNTDDQHPYVFNPIPSAILVSGHYRNGADYADEPIITYVDEIHEDRFKVCVTKDNLSPSDLKDVAFDWVAFD